MAAITWARSVRCDYPGCKSEGEVKLREGWPDRTLPAGWLDLSAVHVMLQDAVARRYNEFCSIHSSFSLSQVTAALKIIEDGRDSDGDGN